MLQHLRIPTTGVRNSADALEQTSLYAADNLLNGSDIESSLRIAVLSRSLVAVLVLLKCSLSLDILLSMKELIRLSIPFSYHSPFCPKQRSVKELHISIGIVGICLGLPV